MKSIEFISLRHLGSRSRAGFSLLEVLLVVSAVGVFAGLAVFAANRLRLASQEVKLERDVAAINTAVQSYLGNGGSLPESLTPEEVIERLKTKVEGDEAAQLVGHRGPFLDPRVRGRSTKDGNVPRATWNSNVQRFAISNSERGITEFYLDHGSGAENPRRRAVQPRQFAKLMAWVWDFDGDGSSVAPKRRAKSGPARWQRYYSSPARVNLRRLAPPVFSIPGGIHRYELFPMPLTLANPNPEEASRIFYSINNGPWQIYDGLPISLSRNALNIGVQAYVSSVSPELWEDSGSEGELYQTVYFIGRPLGGWNNPVGDSNLRTNLTAGVVNSHFEWETPSSGYTHPCSMDFTPSPTFGVVPEQEFKVGEISYFNGTTRSGTNATSVELKIGLSLDVPRGTETLTLRLVEQLESAGQCGILGLRVVRVGFLRFRLVRLRVLGWRRA